MLTLLSVTAALAVTGGLVLAAPAPAGEGPTSYATLTAQGPAVWEPSDYDGSALTSDAPDGHDLPVVHGVYVYASDQPSRFADYAAYFQAEQRRASAFLTSATGMAFRWDERTATDGRVLHDITVVRSKANFKTLSGSRQFSLVKDALTKAGLNEADKKYYVWLDAKSEYCGQAQVLYDAQRSAANKANGTSIAISYRPTGSEEKYADVGGWCNPVLHELSHGLGAVATHMPNYYSGGHCDDDAQDVMCVPSASPGGKVDPTRPRTYDGGNDDYLDPAADLAVSDGGKLGWWTVNLSRFLCPRSVTDPSVPDCTRANTPTY